MLEKAGVERIDAAGKPFDPTEHEAVLHEDGDGEPVVSDILRTGIPAQGSRAATGDGEGSEIARWPRSVSGSTRTTTPCSACPRVRPRRRSRARTASSRSSTTPTRTRGTTRPRRSSRRSRRPTTCSATRRSARSTTRSGAWSRPARTARGPGGGGFGGRRRPGGFSFDDGVDLGDLLGGLFGGGGGRRARRVRARRSRRRGRTRHAPQRGSDLETELHLDFMDADPRRDDLGVVHGRGRVLGVPRQRRRAGHRRRRPARDCGGSGPDRGGPGPVLVLPGVPHLRRARRDHRDAVPPLPRQRGRGAAARGQGEDPDRGRRRPADPGEGTRRRGRERRTVRATSTSSSTSGRTRSSGARVKLDLTVHVPLTFTEAALGARGEGARR